MVLKLNKIEEEGEKGQRITLSCQLPLCLSWLQPMVFLSWLLIHYINNQERLHTTLQTINCSSINALPKSPGSFQQGEMNYAGKQLPKH